MENSYAEFAQRDAQIIALAHQTVEEANTMVTNVSAVTGRISFPVLADMDRIVSDSYNVIQPSVFIINQDGRIVWDYVGDSNIDRPSKTAILDHLP